MRAREVDVLKAPASAARAFAAATQDDDRFAVWGGFGGRPERILSDGYVFSFSRTTWDHIPEAPLSPRIVPGIAFAGDDLLVWGGQAPDGSECFADGAVFSFSGRRWREMPEAPLAPRSPRLARSIGGRVLVWGGQGTDDGTTPQEIFYLDGAWYDVGADAWAAMPTAPIAARNDPIVVIDSDRLLVAGGYAGSSMRGEDVRLGGDGSAHRPREPGMALDWLLDGALFDLRRGSWAPARGLPHPARATFTPTGIVAIGLDGETVRFSEQTGSAQILVTAGHIAGVDLMALCASTSGEVFALSQSHELGLVLSRLEPTEWTAANEVAGPVRVGAAVVCSALRIVVWGGQGIGKSRTVADGLSFRLD